MRDCSAACCLLFEGTQYTYTGGADFAFAGLGAEEGDRPVDDIGDSKGGDDGEADGGGGAVDTEDEADRAASYSSQLLNGKGTAGGGGGGASSSSSVS